MPAAFFMSFGNELLLYFQHKLNSVLLNMYLSSLVLQFVFFFFSYVTEYYLVQCDTLQEEYHLNPAAIVESGICFHGH